MCLNAQMKQDLLAKDYASRSKLLNLYISTTVTDILSLDAVYDTKETKVQV